MILRIARTVRIIYNKVRKNKKIKKPRFVTALAAGIIFFFSKKISISKRGDFRDAYKHVVHLLRTGTKILGKRCVPRVTPPADYKRRESVAVAAEQRRRSPRATRVPLLYRANDTVRRASVHGGAQEDPDVMCGGCRGDAGGRRVTRAFPLPDNIRGTVRARARVLRGANFENVTGE